jgi:enoyl-CoA hydratase
MSYEEIRYEEHGDVAVIVLDRPEARNALTHTTYAELEQAVRTTEARCLVVTGADPAFCSGDDVKQVMVAAGERVASGLAREPRLTPAADALLHTDVPVVAAVNGAAVGWGMELALMADIRVASERARFGELFVKRGLCCDAPGLARLAQVVGREAAAELLFTGRIVDAEEAKQMRLVSRVVGHDDLLPAALEVCVRLSTPTGTSSAAGSARASPSSSAPRITRKGSPPSWKSASLATWAGELGDGCSRLDLRHREPELLSSDRAGFGPGPSARCGRLDRRRCRGATRESERRRLRAAGGHRRTRCL